MDRCRNAICRFQEERISHSIRDLHALEHDLICSPMAPHGGMTMNLKCWNAFRGVWALAIGTFMAGGVSIAAPQALSPKRLLEVCNSQSIAEVTAKGNQLGWETVPATDPSTVEWRKSFVSYNGGSVDVVGWRKTSTENVEVLSFWVAEGPNAHKACSYSINVADGLLDALIELLGRPSTLHKDEVSTTAFWKQGTREISYSQVGTAAGVVISP